MTFKILQKNDNEVMTLIGNTEGKLHVQRQVQDYALRSVEFEMMGFLTFTVETYERRMVLDNENNDHDVHEESNQSTINQYGRYLTDHPKSTTHTRVYRSENHNFLPNIVGCWLPRRDGEESTKPYYYASMLAFLKPWRDLRCLKDECDSWESAFERYMRNATQRDKDVVAGCQYYYDTRTAVDNRDTVDEINGDGDSDLQQYRSGDVDEETEVVDESSSSTSVSKVLSFFF